MKKEMRSEPRLPERRRGTLIVDGITSPCLFQDFSTKGFLLMSTNGLTDQPAARSGGAPLETVESWRSAADGPPSRARCGDSRGMSEPDTRA